jgi:hypothetical protein
VQEIKLIIGKDGKVNIDVAGVSGPACQNLTKSIETALGKTESVKKKRILRAAEGGTKQRLGNS